MSLPSPPIGLTNDFESCMLSLKDDEAQNERTGIVNIHLDSTLDLGNFCQNNDIECLDVFNAAWSLTLFAYTGLDLVLFGNTITSNTYATDTIPTMNGFQEVIRIAKLDTSTLIDVVYSSKAYRVQQKSLPPRSQSKLNTSIYFSETAIEQTMVQTLFETTKSAEYDVSPISRKNQPRALHKILRPHYMSPTGNIRDLAYKLTKNYFGSLYHHHRDYWS